MGIILSARGFGFRYGTRWLLQDVDLDISAGTRCAIVGPNGAGKSTLLKSFCRILPAGQGELQVGGIPLAKISQRELATWISYVPQSAGAEHIFTVKEFVLLGRYPYLSPFSTVRHADWQAVEQALVRTGTQDFADRRLKTLSAGEQQKVLIAAALVQGSRVMLLDEPAAFLDPYQQDQIYALLESLHQEAGKTLVEVTHDVNRAALGHDRIIGLRSGRVVFNGTPEELMQMENLEKIYGKRFTLMPHPANNRLVALPEVQAWAR